MVRPRSLSTKRGVGSQDRRRLRERTSRHSGDGKTRPSETRLWRESALCLFSDLFWRRGRRNRRRKNAGSHLAREAAGAQRQRNGSAPSGSPADARRSCVCPARSSRTNGISRSIQRIRILNTFVSIHLRPSPSIRVFLPCMASNRGAMLCAKTNAFSFKTGCHNVAKKVVWPSLFCFLQQCFNCYKHLP